MNVEFECQTSYYIYFKNTIPDFARMKVDSDVFLIYKT